MEPFCLCFCGNTCSIFH